MQHLLSCRKLFERREVMMYTDQRAARPDIDSWEPGFCYTSFCKERILYVQRCDMHPELWRIALTPGESGWLVAAPGPLCPLCGGTLLTPAAFEEGLEAKHRTS
jgi:hypothetical protein